MQLQTRHFGGKDRVRLFRCFGDESRVEAHDSRITVRKFSHSLNPIDASLDGWFLIQLFDMAVRLNFNALRSLQDGCWRGVWNGEAVHELGMPETTSKENQLEI